MRRSLLFSTAALAAGLAAGACGDTQSNSGTPAQAQTAKATQVAACVQGSIKADGSSAIKSLIQKAADQYQQKCPGATIQVAATNSSTGVTKASSGAVDIGNSDVPAGLVQGVDASTVVDHPVAIVLFAIAVNPDTGVKNLTAQQIQDIFAGKVTNWSQVGGASIPVAVMERKPGSGTRITFDKDLMAGTAETSNPSQVIDTTQTVVQALTQTSGSVSYLTLSAVKGTSLAAVSIDGEAAGASSVKDGKYRFFSHEHCFTSPTPSQLTQSFIQYVLTPEFQTGTLTSSGYLPLSTTDRQAAVDK